MFYSQVILAKKGPLAKVWLAAHWGDKKLARPQIFATDISQSCTDIMNPRVPLALRLSGHLLLGVVRIYSRKVKYVLNDCTEAMLKLQMAFTKQSGNPDSGKEKAGLLSEKDAPTHQLVSNFGEFDQVHVVEGFCLPLPEDNEWILAEDDDDVDGIEDSALLTAHLPTSSDRRGRISPDRDNEMEPQEETWAPFDPDEEGEGDGPKAPKDKNEDEQSRVSDIEIVRAANDSMLSEDQTRRSTPMAGDKSGLLSEDGPGAVPGGPQPQDEDIDDFQMPFADDSEDEQQPQGPEIGGVGGVGGDGLNLEISRDSGAETTPGGLGSIGKGLGLGLDDESSQASKKREMDEEEDKKTPRRRRRKRRKVVIDNNETELTNDHIRNMLANTDDIVRPMIHPATIWDKEGRGRDYKTLVKEFWAKEGIVIQTSVTGPAGRSNKKMYKGMELPSLTQPFLADEASKGGPNLHPALRKLWDDNYWMALGNPCPYERDDGLLKEDEDDNEQASKVSDIEQVRRDNSQAEDDSDIGTQLSGDPRKQNQSQGEDDGAPQFSDGPPVDEDDFNMPVADDDEDEEDMPVTDFVNEDEVNINIDGDREDIDMLELGMVNDMVLDTDQEDDNDDDDADRQAIGDVASSSTKWHKHTLRVYQHLKKNMNDDGSKDLPEQLSFKQLTRNVTSRRNAAAVFFEILQLKTWDFIEVDQQESYGDIVISPGVRYNVAPPN